MVLSKLQNVMSEKNISPEHLANAAGVSVRTIENARRGKGVSLNTGKHIAKGIKIKLEELV